MNTKTKNLLAKVAMGVVAVIVLLTLLSNVNNRREISRLRASLDKELLRSDSLLSVKLLTEKTLTQREFQLDKTSKLLDEASSQLAQARATLAAKENEVRKLQKAYTGNVQKLQKELKSLQELRLTLETQLTEQSRLVESLRQELEQMNHSNEKLQGENAELIKYAKILRAEQLNVRYTRQTRRSEQHVNKLTRTNILVVSATIAANPVADPGQKVAYLLVFDENGSIVDPQRELFVNKQTGKSERYTMKREFVYQNSVQKLELQVKLPEKLKSKGYSCQLYIDGESSNSLGFINVE